MDKRKVWQFLSLLSEDDQQSWLGYLRFRFGNRQAYLQQLASFLVDTFPEPPSNEAAWEHLYPGIPYDDARLRKLSGDLTHQVEQFLSLQAFDQSPLDQGIQLLNSLLSQSDAGLFGKTWKKVCKDVYRLADSASEIAEYRYQLEVLNREYRIRHRMKDGAFWIPPQETWWGDADTLQRISYLNTAWDVFKGLYLSIDTRISSKKTGSQLKVLLGSELIQVARTDRIISQFPLINLYLKVLDLVDHKTGMQSEGLVRYLYKYAQYLPPTELTLLFNSLLNTMVRQLNQFGGRREALNLVKHYDWGVTNGILLVDGVLNPVHYKNMIGLCLRIEDRIRAKELLDKYKPLLPSDVKEELYLFNQIFIQFAEGNFHDTIRLVSKSRFSQTQDEVDVRVVNLQAHFELAPQNKEWLLDQINALIRYTNSRSELSPMHKSIYTSRLRLYRKLFVAQLDEEIESLEALLDANPSIDKGGWVRGKVWQLKNRKSPLPETTSR